MVDPLALEIVLLKLRMDVVEALTMSLALNADSRISGQPKTESLRRLEARLETVGIPDDELVAHYPDPRDQAHVRMAIRQMVERLKEAARVQFRLSP